MKNGKPLSIEAVLTLPAGGKDSPTWLNNVEACVLSVVAKTTKDGKPYWLCMLGGDGEGEITMSLWTAPKFFAGQKIMIGGQGTRLTEFGGKKQITVSQKTEISVLSAEQRAAANVASQSLSPAPASSPSFRSSPAPVHDAPLGPTVGMAVKAAVDILLHNAAMERQEIPTVNLAEKIIAKAREILIASDALSQPPASRLFPTPKLAERREDNTSPEGVEEVPF